MVELRWITGKPISDSDLLGFMQLNPQYLFERSSDGDLVVTPPAGGKSASRNLELSRQFANWNDRCGNGVGFDSSVGFALPDLAVQSPDAAWIARERWDALSSADQERWSPICPDVVIELVSKTDGIEATCKRLKTFLGNGARFAVMLDPYGDHVECYTYALDLPTVHGSEPLTIDKHYFPGATDHLTLDVAKIFRG